jgi:lipopolysaccharide transport system ATP-binding protein
MSAVLGSNDRKLIELNCVGKRYSQSSGGHGRLRTLATMLVRGQLQGFAALSDVNLEIFRGQSLGLVGENGAGKSTLLKLIAGVLKPTSGEIKVHGRVGALLELGSGFHPEYTGRENIFLASALIGLSRAETQDKLDSIISFADIGSYIDQPIKHYSSGMVVRLGFAVATTLSPDILITDEVLAVGDEAFQRKCIRWMQNYLDQGGTLLLCSHGLYHIQKLCANAVWLHEGRIRQTGRAADVTREYLAHQEEKSARQKANEAPPPPKMSDSYTVTEFAIVDDNDVAVNTVAFGGSLIARGRVYSPDGRVPNVAIGLVRADGTPVYGISNEVDGIPLTRNGNGEFEFRLRFPNVTMLPGRYTIRAHALDPESIRLLDTHEFAITVTGDRRELGLTYLEHDWLEP